HAAGGQPAAHELVADVTQWRVVARESGPNDYYAIVRDPVMPFLRARYEPPWATTVLGFAVPDALRSKVRQVRWKWRAITLPLGGDECTKGRGDSAAVVYVTWKRGIRWYTLKYVWSAVAPLGAVCDRKRNLFVAQDTVILETGGPLGAWRSEEIDLPAQFRQHFEGGRADAAMPDFLGLGIMTDGDQTRSESAADYAQFALAW
ncbi:MAG: DUF3047 domain-containing protein, partial [Myxococcota bacterium]|nr:DUF3047 domain-containing protein [Myxococcota bacterium]